MSRETINLICAELPGAEKGNHGSGDVWSAGHEPFARIEDDGLTVGVLDAGGWASLGPDAPETAIKERIVAAYLAARARLPEEIRVTLDRTSG